MSRTAVWYALCLQHFMSKLTAIHLVCASIVVLLINTGCKPESQNSATERAPTRPQPAEKPPVTPPQAGGPASSSQRSVGEVIDDATITAKVKAALVQSSEVSGTAINVDTAQGKVILKGSVRSQAAADRAVQIARNIEGATDVENHLTVRE